MSWTTHSLRADPVGAGIARVLQAALAAVDPGRGVKQALCRNDGVLEVAGHRWQPGTHGRLWLIAVGKAAPAMTLAALDVVGSGVENGVLVAKHLPVEFPSIPGITMMCGGHPIPDTNSIAAGQAIRTCLDGAGKDDLVLCLLSGGASALIAAPPPELTLSDLRQVTDALLLGGADITELNTVRKHLDRLKGGGILQHAAPATVVTLVISDVVGDPLQSIASGPTVGDSSSFADALAVLERYAVSAPRVWAYLRQGRDGEHLETLSPDAAVVERSTTTIIARNADAIVAARHQAKVEGWVVVDHAPLCGVAREVGQALGEALAVMRPTATTCMLAGGETTVHVTGPGRGGRNQELALAAVEPLDGQLGRTLVTLATDGEDGPTDAAGAVVTGDTAGRARALGLSAQHHLNENNAYPFFAALDDLLRLGPTGTNVCDLLVAVARPNC